MVENENARREDGCADERRVFMAADAFYDQEPRKKTGCVGREHGIEHPGAKRCFSFQYVAVFVSFHGFLVLLSC